MSDPRSDDLENLTGAYALDAVSPQERASLEAAMTDSEALRTEVVELTDTAVELGLAVPPVQPSPGLRAAVLAAIEDLPQDARDGDAAATPSRREVRDLPGPAQRRAAGRWGRVGVMLTAAAAVAALVVGGIAVTHFTNPMTVLASAQDAEQVTEDFENGGTATILWSESLGQAAVTVSGVSQLPGDLVYQLWYIGDDIRPAGTFTRDSTIVLAGTMHEGDAIGITIEPDGGSAQPTSDPILAVQT